MRDFQRPGRSAVYADNGMVATSHPMASQLAVQILREGGNAVDAAIGAGVLLGVCEPHMTGLGGDCFVLMKPAGAERVIALNGSGRAPAALDARSMRAAGHRAVPTYGVEAVTVPGAVDAFCRLSADWGRMDLARVLDPVIEYFDAGVPVAPRVARDWRGAAHLKGAGAAHFLPGGQAPGPGTRFALPGHAEVLRRIAREGRAGFYEGEVAQDMVDSLRALGGCHTMEDFAATACDDPEPVSGLYHGTELVEHPPNGPGPVAILMLNILSHFDLTGLDPFGAARIHLEAEATRLAYDARNRFLADPDSDPDQSTRLAHMLAPETAARLAALIDPKHARATVAPLTEAIHRDTVYLSVVDRDRMAVSLICSVFHLFGSGLASDRFGIGFHNRGAGFTLQEGHANEAAGGKRPAHTLIPGMLRDGRRVTMPFGVMGGAYQPAGHARLVSNLVDYGMDLQAALDAPRAFSGFLAGRTGLALETGHDDAVRSRLEAMGHDVYAAPNPLGGAQAILLDQSGVLIGASDPRKDGCALGY